LCTAVYILLFKYIAPTSNLGTGDYRYHRAKTLPSNNHHLDHDLQLRSIISTTTLNLWHMLYNIWCLQYMPHNLRHLQHMSCRVPSGASAAYGTAFTTSTNLQHTLDGAGADTIVMSRPWRRMLFAGAAGGDALRTRGAGGCAPYAGGHGRC